MYVVTPRFRNKVNFMEMEMEMEMEYGMLCARRSCTLLLQPPGSTNGASTCLKNAENCGASDASCALTTAERRPAAVMVTSARNQDVEGPSCAKKYSLVMPLTTPLASTMMPVPFTMDSTFCAPFRFAPHSSLFPQARVRAKRSSKSSNSSNSSKNSKREQ